MGGQFSLGPYPDMVVELLETLPTVVLVNGRLFKFQRAIKDREFRADTFISMRETRWTFGLTERQTYDLFMYLDPNHLGRIPVFELWGCLALATSDQSDDKVDFLLNMADLNHDGFLGKSDLFSLLTCATRGLSLIKSNEIPRSTDIRKLVRNAFKSKIVNVNERGEAPIRELRAYLLSNDTVRTYLSNLSADKEEKPDTDAMASQRTEVIRQLAEVRAELAQMLNAEELVKKDQQIFEKERGGDVSLLKISVDTSDPTHALNTEVKVEDNEAAADGSAYGVREARVGDMMTEAQKLRRMNAKKRQDAKIEDADVFSSRRRGKPTVISTVGVSNATEQAVLHHWSKLPQDDDFLVELDIDMIEDLFESGGVMLSDYEAQKCLDTVQANKLHRFNVKDVLKWYRWHSSGAARAQQQLMVPHASLPLWRRTAKSINEYLENLRSETMEVFQKLGIQRSIKAELARIRDVVIQAQERENAYQFIHIEDVKSAEAAALAVPHTPSHDILGEIQGFARLSAWQRQQQYAPVSGRFELSGVFDSKINTNPDDEEGSNTTSRKGGGGGGGRQSARNQPAAAKKSARRTRESQREKEEAERMKYKATIFVDGYLRPKEAPADEEEKKKMKADVDRFIIDEEKRFIPDMKELTPSHILDYFENRIKAQQELQAGNEKSEKGSLAETEAELDSFGAVSWLFIEVHPSATADQAQALVISLTNFFDSIPHESRCGLYDRVEGDIFFTPNEDAAIPPSNAVSWANVHNLTHRVALVALLRGEDFLRELEEQIPPGILISRVLREFKFELKFGNTLDEMYKMSKPYEILEERLFGPQEDELGEEGMNPLRYAKACRDKTAAAREDIANAKKMSLETIKEKLRARGLVDSGTRDELNDRFCAMRQRDIESIAVGGELSAFGADMVTKIFNAVKGMAPLIEAAEELGMGEVPSLTIWDINRYLALTNSTNTVYDRDEYKMMLAEMELLMDRRGAFTKDTLRTYYEIFGRLGSDVRDIGIGSLDEFLLGTFKLVVEYESEAVKSLLDLVEDHSSSHPILKSILVFFTSLNDMVVESEYERLSHVLEAFITAGEALGAPDWGGRKLLEYVRSPGWLAGAIHGFQQALADRDAGLIRSLRQSVLQEFAKYDKWEAPFKQFFEAVEMSILSQMQPVEVETVPMEGVLDGDLSISRDPSVSRQTSLTGTMTAPGTAATSSNQQHEGGLPQALPQSPLGTAATTNAAATAPSSPIKQSATAESAVSQTSQASSQTTNTTAAAAAANSNEKAETGAPGAAAAPGAAFGRQTTGFGKNDLAQRCNVQPVNEEAIAFIREKLRMFLPDVEDNRDLVRRIKSLTDDADRLARIMADEHFRLSRMERDAARRTKDQCEAEAAELAHRLEKLKKLSAAHACAAYDCLRLWGKGIKGAGLGTRELCIRAAIKGFDIFTYLPEALGEPCYTRKAREDKLKRATQRKNAALAALERERIRRAMTEEEKERMRIEEEEKAQLARDEEESKIFATAFHALSTVRQVYKSPVEITDMVKQFEKLTVITSRRYPTSTKTALCHNNYAVVLLEFFGHSQEVVGRSRAPEAMAHLEKAVTIIMNRIEGRDPDHPDSDDEDDDNGESEKKKELPPKRVTRHRQPSMLVGSADQHNFGTALAGWQRKQTLPMHLVSPCILMLQNYVTFLKQSSFEYLRRHKFEVDEVDGIPERSFFRDRDTLAGKAIHTVYELYEALSEREKGKVALGAVRSIANLPVFAMEKHYDSMMEALDDIVRFRDEARRKIEEDEERERKREEDERQAALEAELEAKAEEDKDSDEDEFGTIANLSPRSLAKWKKKERREKFEKQIKEANVKRSRLNKQRRKLYSLIESNEISEIFALKADPVDQEVPMWADDEKNNLKLFDEDDLEEDDDDDEGSWSSSSKRRSKKKKGKSRRKGSDESSVSGSRSYSRSDSVSESGSSSYSSSYTSNSQSQSQLRGKSSRRRLSSELRSAANSSRRSSDISQYAADDIDEDGPENGGRGEGGERRERRTFRSDSALQPDGDHPATEDTAGAQDRGSQAPPTPSMMAVGKGGGGILSWMFQNRQSRPVAKDSTSGPTSK